MIVTEEEARKLDCCRFEKKCNASGCMSWVEHYKHEHRGSGIQVLEPHRVYTGKGYCGLSN